MIQLPIEIGDIIRVGRFKNKKITVKEIGVDENNHPTVNGRGILKVRIEKLMSPKEPRTEIQEVTGKQPIKFIGFRKNNDGKIVEYIESITQDLGKEFKGPVVKFGFLSQFTGLKGSKEKGWFRVNKSTIRWEKYGVIWDEGMINLDIKQDIQENNMNENNDRQILSAATKLSQFFRVENQRDNIIKILRKTQFDENGVPLTNVSLLTKILNSTSDEGTKNIVKSSMKESFKPNKAKLDKMISKLIKEEYPLGKIEKSFEFLEDKKPIKVKFQEKNGRHWIIQEESENVLGSAAGYETKDTAKQSALILGFHFEGVEDMQGKVPEIPKLTKAEPVKYDKPEEVKLDKEKELKMEILRIAKRIIREETNKLNEFSLKKKLGLNELEVTDPEITSKIEEMAKLSDEMDRLAAEMAKLKAKFQPLDEEITKLMDETEKTGDRALETKNVLITIKRKGYESESVAWKEFYIEYFPKLNKRMREQATELLAAHTKIKKVGTSLAVQYKKTEGKLNEENFISRMLNKVKSYFSGLFGRLMNRGKEIDSILNKMKSIS